MIWGRTLQEERDRKDRRARNKRYTFKNQKPPNVRFAFLPVQLENGKWLWLDFVYVVEHQRAHIGGIHFFYKFYACKIEFSPVE